MSFKRGYYDVFLKTCAKNPSKIAVRHYHDGVYKIYTYSELYGVCEYITQSLQQLQCSKGIIGLVSKRNIIIPCVIAAAHKCCRTFMFLDPAHDIESIANSLKLNVIINIQDTNTADTSELFGKKPDKIISVFDIQIKFYNLETQCNNLLEYSFIAMTSGSTGEPKHIQVPIQCIQPNIDDLTKLFNIVPQDVVYFSTPLTFDPSMIEILLACMNGASLLIAPDEPDILFPDNGQHSVTFWQTTPSKFLQHSNEDIKNKILSANSTLKVLALGGEPFNGVTRLKELKDFKNKTRIYTLYGVTEMSCWACAAELELDRVLTDKEVPLGDCLSETQIVIDPDSHENKDTGKIILVSKSRKCIVLNKSQGNEEEDTLKFVDTGDLGEMTNGNIYYRGRKDDVVKRFGHKINLQFIESTIMKCPAVKTCSCLWLPKPLLLVVYFSSETLSSQELSDFLKCKLDDKHWPDKILRVDNIPMNPHGKVSKSVISKMHENVINDVLKTSDSVKMTFLKELQLVMRQNFSYDEVKHKDFFALGGTSFLAVTMCNKLSLTFPQFGKFILPYLMSQKHTINEIIQLSQKEWHIEDTKPKRNIKRTLSDARSVQESPTHKKANTSNDNNPMEFMQLWNYDTGKCVDASPTLSQIGFKLYAIVGSHSGKIVVMDAMSGKLQGMITLKARVEASVFCHLEDPESTSCGVVGAYDGTIVCFAIETCREIWKININSMIKSRATCCNGLLYMASYDGRIRCIDILTGEIKDTIQVANLAISADLVLAKKQYVIAASLSGECVGVQAGPGGSVSWRARTHSPVFANPVLYDDDKYVVFAEVNGEVHCRTVEKGIEVWKYQGAKGNIFSSIYIKKVDTLKWQLVFGCHDNKVYCINIKNSQPSLHWKTQLTSPVYSTPCALNEKIILAASNNGKLCTIDSENGILLSEHSLPGETFSSPAVFGDYIFIGCRNDHFYSLKHVSSL